jgi:hypothetical protein
MSHSTRTRATALTLTAFLVLAGAASLAADNGRPRALVGSWLETVTFAPEAGRPPLKSLSTFHDDGTMVCSDQGAVTTDPPSVFTSCHGVWAHLDHATFTYTARELVSDLSGNLVGYLKVRGVYAVSATGDQYTGTTFAELVDADGNVLFSGSVTNTGERIKAEVP